MPRPTTKNELLIASQEQYEKLLSMIESDFDFHINIATAGKEAHWSRDKNLRDVLVHLYEWHILAINWVEGNIDGKSCNFLPEPYTWKTYGDMNIEFWKKHQSTSYDDAYNLFNKSHKLVTNLAEKFSDEELFIKKHFPWTGTTNLASYFISCTSSHYDWAIKKIKTHNKLVKSGAK